MTQPTATYDEYDVVVVPFPFTDLTASKRRPALVLSHATAFNDPAGHSVMAMITCAVHAGWPHDVRIRDLGPAGLPSPSLVRFKLFTLDHRLVLRCAGRLSSRDQASVRRALGAVLGFEP